MAELQHILNTNRDRFVAFLAKRIGDPAQAEELFQSAIVRSLERGIPAEDEQAAVTWFYRVLRNALVDHHRRRAVEGRARESLLETEATAADPELEETVCSCVNDLVPTLKAEYAEIVQAVDLESRPVSEVAARLGVTPNNAMVRLHRARKALKERLLSTCGHCAETGCLDCSCKNKRARLTYRER
jgi:RNA polymerase sigma factor (sigma-70 family)